MERRLAEDPADLAWHATIDKLLEPGQVATFGLVWELPRFPPDRASSLR